MQQDSVIGLVRVKNKTQTYTDKPDTTILYQQVFIYFIYFIDFEFL